jgi:hypothetical protein
MDNSDKILNPTTGRYVKKSSVLGKQLLAGITPTKKSKACSDTQIRNPNTNRCIKKNGKLAKSLGNSPASSIAGSKTMSNSYNNSSSSSPIALPVTNSVVPPPPPENLTTISENKKMRNAQLSTAFINILKSDPNATPEQLGSKYIEQVKNVNATTLQSAFRQKLARKRIEQQKNPETINEPLRLMMANAFVNKLQKTQDKQTDKLNNNATTIQNAFRQKLARKKLQQNALETINEPLRLMMANAFVNKLQKKQETQKAQGRSARKRQNRKLRKLIANTKAIAEKVEKDDKAATTIQNAFRQKLARKRMEKQPEIKKQQRYSRYISNASQTIRNMMPALVGAGTAVGLGLSGAV